LNSKFCSVVVTLVVIAIVDLDDVADAVVAGDPTVATRAKIPTIPASAPRHHDLPCSRHHRTMNATVIPPQLVLSVEVELPSIWLTVT
jgi:hypothetical protein